MRRAASNAALPEDVRREALALLGESAAASAQARAEATRAFAQLGDPEALPENLAETWRRFVQRAEHVESVGDFTALAREGNAAEQTLAYTVLLKVAHAGDSSDGDSSNGDSSDGGNENSDVDEATRAAREKARAAIEAAWESPQRTVRLLRAIGHAKAEAYADRVQALLSEDAAAPGAVRRAAAFASERIAAAVEAETSSSE